MFEILYSRGVSALLAGLTLIFEGFAVFYDARRAMFNLGFSPRVACSPAAVPPMMAYGLRTIMTGVLIVIFYFQRKFAAADTVVLTNISYAGWVEGYLIWREGNGGKAMVRIVTGLLLGLMVLLV
ncbi:hypothetical protein F5Y10DRAFT_74926 [Nemania abortiva]|nr:hypothetical protein F5Y10DRAFT_74926 [Nemania abortiva]